MLDRICIIGSGAGAIGGIWNLVQRGIKPIVLDVGEMLPPEITKEVNEYRKTYPNYKGQLFNEIFNNSIEGDNFPKKLNFGSDYFHSNLQNHSKIDNNTFISPSYAMGGYGAAWGGAMLPISNIDLSDWPIELKDLEDGYRNITEMLNLGTNKKISSDVFHNYSEKFNQFESGINSEIIYERLKKFNNDNFSISSSRLAFDSQLCVNCGNCLSGCPFNAIQTFDKIIIELIKNNQIDYNGNIVVKKIKNMDGYSLIEAVEKNSLKRVEFKFKKIILAAGAINSTRILMNSLGFYNQDVKMLDSQKFGVPFLTLFHNLNGYENQVKLPKLFMDFIDPKYSSNWVHIQISDSNYLVINKIKTLFKFTGEKIVRILSKHSSRLMIGWGGVNSSISGHFLLNLEKISNEETVLKIRSIKNDHGIRILNKMLRRFSFKILRRGVIMFTPFKIIAPVGGGFHIGGSMPMRKDPSGILETDLYGKNPRLPGVSIVDASVLPSLPSTTLALTIMANSWRIANTISTSEV